MKKQKVLFVYTFESKTGLSSKASKIEQGFRDAGCCLDAVYFGSAAGRIKRIFELLALYLDVSLKLVFGRYDVVFLRYAYYFLPVYFFAFLVRRDFQVEVNSNVRDELIGRGQRVRYVLDSLAERFVRYTAKKIHVVSKSLTEKLNRQYPSANYVFTANFVVDENYYPKNEVGKDRINLVFMGNCAQPWHGIPLFLDVIIGAQSDWFNSLCTLHFIGHVDEETKNAVLRNNLTESVRFHGLLFAEEKHAALRNMDLGLSSFDLNFKGMTETTAIKTAEYLYNGIGLVIGYEDPVIPSSLPFVLTLDMDGDPEKQCAKFKAFVAGYRNISGAAEAAHKYAKKHLLVNKYIARILSEDL
ncbi:MAG: hypothetical protein KC592_15140 [Nitrospira sp.]|nr:hypothetical protein [Nitrospira sp.]